MRLLTIAAMSFVLVGCGSGSISIPGLTSPSFSQADAEKAKDTVRQMYAEKSGVTVLDVEMMRETSTKLTGFVKFKKQIFFSDHEFSKQCSAVLGQDGQYIIHCS
jgi:hypothetical protein